MFLLSMAFENLVNYDISQATMQAKNRFHWFENLVNYDISQAEQVQALLSFGFENLVNYDISQATAAMITRTSCV